MQASLPRLVRMVCVEDLGQGSEPLRILGVRWLPKGAAGAEVTDDGKLDDDNAKHHQIGGAGQDQRGTTDLTKENEEEKEADDDAS